MFFDTIAAIATPPGEGGIGIIRISGSEAWEIGARFFRPVSGIKLTDLKSHSINYGHFINDKDEVLDECLVTIMRAPKTFTREDTVEINCHGGSLPLWQIMKVLLANGVRLAEPGEFTKRAFLNGRIDLVQAESIIDIIRAKTDFGLKTAVNQLNGSLSRGIGDLRKKLLELLAMFEANIDFPEDDVPPVAYEEVDLVIEGVLAQVMDLLASWDEGKIYRDGLKTVIVGRPNVGKSSLLNVLVREDRAIVTDIPGTTRDVIEEVVYLQGIPLRIMDTAGIRETNDVIEKIGVEKSMKLVDAADLILLVIEANEPLTGEDLMLLEKVKEKKVIVLLNKTDLQVNLYTVGSVEKVICSGQVLKISTKDQRGLNLLADKIKKLVFSGKAYQKAPTLVTNARHYGALAKAAEHLENVKIGLAGGLPVDLLSIDLTAAYQDLGELTGQTVGEDILEQIFAQFCIGK